MPSRAVAFGQNAPNTEKSRPKTGAAHLDDRTLEECERRGHSSIQAARVAKMKRNFSPLRETLCAAMTTAWPIERAAAR
jgi:hypothetical protein